MYDHQHFGGCEEIAISTSQRIIGIETPDFAFRNCRVKLVPIQIAERFSLPCLGFSFLFRGVQRGYFSFQRVL